MAERADPSVDDHDSKPSADKPENNIHDSNPSAEKPENNNHDSNSSSDQPENNNQLAPPAFRCATYVVQVPKDQIFCVPPPENAVLAERHGNPFRSSKGKKPRPRRPRCCLCISVSVVLLVLVLALIAAAVYVLLTPKDPTFHVERVVVKNNTRPDYGITIRAKNLNEIMGIDYKAGGVASLSFKQRGIAKGKYPSFKQDSKKSTSFRVDFHGSNIVLPKEIEKSMKSQKPKIKVSLSLKMDVHARIRVGALHYGSVKFVAACDFTVDTLAKNSRILSQKCHT